MTTRLLLATALLLLHFTLLAQQPAKPAYDQLVERAAALLKEGKLSEAASLVEAAISLDARRPEAVKLAAEINAATKKKFQQGQDTGARPPAEPPRLTPEARRKMDVLTLIVEEADKATTADERRRRLEEFLDQSEPFVKEHSDQSAIWLLRAVAAMELDQNAPARKAGRTLMKLGLDHSDDPKTRKVMAMLDRKGWLVEIGHSTNSLGMVFAPVGQVGFCIWETRVQDYATYAGANPGVDGSWRSDAGGAHPVVNVSWDDAQAFCRWLTEKERGEGKIPANAAYRLPTDAEWSQAVGIGGREGAGSPKEKDGKLAGVFPWGAEWPPPKGAGNYAPPLNVDAFATTAPVASFAANQFGLHDLDGNVWEWCEDLYDDKLKYRVLRGGSWGDDFAGHLLSSFRLSRTPDARYDYGGCRCVLAAGVFR